MDEQTRYRATGGIFLLAVAIICLPMLFDGKGLPPVDVGAPLEARGSLPSVEAIEEIAPQTDFIDRVAEFESQVDEDAFYTDTGTLAGEPVLTEPDDDTSIWAVQVASFRELVNARQMRDRLRGLGYEAFITAVKTDDGLLQRVAVGPLLSEVDARSLQQALTLEVEQEARLMAFSN